MNAASVSVIIPNYNHARFLNQRMTSILSQTYLPTEVIILDDCSTDDSLEVINQFKMHPCVKHIIVNDKNSGSPFLQWQKGIDLANGDWIWIAESDDYADLTFLEKLIEIANNNPSAGILYANSALVYENVVQKETFAELKNVRIRTNKWSSSYFNKGINEINEALLPYGTINNTSAVLFKASVLKTINFLDRPFKYIGDKYVFVKILAQADISYCADTLNFYRANPAGVPKYTQNYFEYTIEHFYILSWVKQNLHFVSKQSLSKTIEENCQFTILPNSLQKLQGFSKMLAISPKLFFRVYWYNVKRTLRKISLPNLTLISYFSPN